MILMRRIGIGLAKRRRGARRRIGHDFAAFARAVRSCFRRAPDLRVAAERFLLRTPRAAAAIAHHHRWFLSRRTHSLLVRPGPRVSPATAAIAIDAKFVRYLTQWRTGPVAGPASPERNVPARRTRASPVRLSIAAERLNATNCSGAAKRARQFEFVRGPRSRRNAPSAFVYGTSVRHTPTGSHRVEVLRRSQNLRRFEDPSLATVAPTVRRAPAPKAAPAQRRQQDEWPPAPRAVGMRPDGLPAMGTAAPQIDVQAVTSQVMRQIDRRLVAWRERTGRV